MNYRCVKSNTNTDCICIALDEDQSGDYFGVGTWQTWITDSIPQISSEISTYAMQNNITQLLKIVDNKLVVKTLEEIQ